MQLLGHNYHRMILNWLPHWEDVALSWHKLLPHPMTLPFVLFHLSSYFFFCNLSLWLCAETRQLFWSYGRDFTTLCVFFCSFCIFSTRSFLSPPHPTIPTSTESRPASYWPVSAFPLSLHRLVGSAHKGRASNHGEAPVNPLQCRPALYLHGDRLSQWRVGSAQDFDPSSQWQWKAQSFWGVHIVNILSEVAQILFQYLVVLQIQPRAPPGFDRFRFRWRHFDA